VTTQQGVASELVEAATGVKRLRVETDSGTIAVEAGAGPSIRIHAETTAQGPYPAETLRRWAGQTRTLTTRTGDQLAVQPERPADTPPDLSLSVSYSVKVPAAMALDLHSQLGAIAARGTTGDVVAESASGRITLSAVRGTLQLRSTAGEIQASEIDGAVRATTTSGGVTLRRIRGPAEAASQLGAIEAAEITGALRVATDSGGVRARDVGGGVRAKSETGAVEASEIRGGAQVTTGSGGVRLRRVAGAIRAQAQLGEVRVEEAHAGSEPVNLETAGGGIAFSGAAADLEVRTELGEVRLALPQLPHGTRVTTASGSVSVALPRAPDLEIRVHTDTGAIEVADLPLPPGAPTPAPPAEGGPGREWAVRLGEGNHSLDVSTATGSIRFRPGAGT
jgi:DUF4097 and DUF4098 domain-containing protein YvlB